MKLEIITCRISSKVGDMLFQVAMPLYWFGPSFGLQANVDYLKKFKGGINDRKF